MTTFAGESAYELIATAPPTNVRLLVACDALRPLAVRFGRRSIAAYGP